MKCVHIAICGVSLLGCGVDATPDTGLDGSGGSEVVENHVPIMCDGMTDDRHAIQAALDAGQPVVLPPGTCVVGSPGLRVITNNTYIQGAGMDATILKYVPVNAGSLLIFEGTGMTPQGEPAPIMSVGLRHLGIRSNANTGADVAKVAVDVRDARNFQMENVAIQQWDSSTASTVGLKIAGRDFGLIRKVWIEADTPIKITLNNRDTNKDLDHHHFEDLMLVSNTAPSPVIKVASTAVLREVTFDGVQSWVNGGFEWVDVGPARRKSNHLRIANVRAEGITNAGCPAPGDPPAYCNWAVRIEKNPGGDGSRKLTELLVDFSLVGGQGIDSPLPAQWNGIRANGVVRTVLRQVTHENPDAILVESDGIVIQDP